LRRTNPTLLAKMNYNNNDNDRADDNDKNDFDLSEFTKEEKLSWLGGYDLWNLRAVPGLTKTACTSSERRISSSIFRSRTHKPSKTSICLADGPHGVRKPLNNWTLQKAHPATCFPSACSTACSWNPRLLETMGRALALECEHYGVQVLLGPGVNLKRHPCGGRNHEYFSEDPYLAGFLAKSYISGVQESGTVGACLKHFCLNNQESNRFIVDAVVDERTMRELYLPAFEHSLCSEDPQSVPKLLMGAYNKVNGVYCCEHEYLLESVLRGEWKYDGVVISDWGAIHDRSASLRAGMDLEMPGTPSRGAFDEEVLEECNNNNNSNKIETGIDKCANRVIRLIADLHPGDKEVPSEDSNEVSARKLFEKHDWLAREIACECIVLLQNKNGFLPLSRDDPKIGLIGGFARDYPRYQGMGSAHVTPTKLTSFYDAMQSLFRGENHTASHTEARGSLVIPFAKGYEPDADDDEIQQSLIDEAVNIAQQPGVDVLVVCVGLPEIAESEGFDRTHSRLPRQHVSLVEALTRVHPNVVVILSNGGIVEIPQSFVEGAIAILDGFLLGQACGSALADVLFGVVSPSGRLPETIPITPDIDVPSASYFPGNQEKVEYREGLDVGYRYYDTAGIPVRFPFGHGLHYAAFEYRNLELSIQRDEATYKRVKVSLDVSNTGKESFLKPSMEVVQLYIKPIGSSVYRPCHELKGFSKVEIAPGSTQTVEFALDERSFSYYDIGWKDWVVEESGGFEVRVGASSRDIRLTETLHFSTGREASELAKESYPPLAKHHEVLSTEPPNRFLIDDVTFAKRFGQIIKTGPGASNSSSSSSPIAEQPYRDELGSSKNKKKEKATAITRNTLIVDAAKASRIASILMFFSRIAAEQEVREGPSKKRELRMIRANLENIPLRSLVVFSQGVLTFRTLDVLIHLMNGEYRKALWRLFRRKRKTRN
jgi:beta-glucosidase